MKDFREYQDFALRMEKELPHHRRLRHHAMGVLGEVGELTDNIKKHIIYGRALDLDNVIEEVGDTMWYLAGFCNAQAYDMQEIVAMVGISGLSGLDLAVLRLGRAAGIACGMVCQHEDITADTVTSVVFGLAEVLYAAHKENVGRQPPSLLAVAQANVEKLRKRYPERYRDADAIARADKNGERA